MKGNWSALWARRKRSAELTVCGATQALTATVGHCLVDFISHKNSVNSHFKQPALLDNPQVSLFFVRQNANEMTTDAICTPPERSEIEARRARAQSAIGRDGLDALVLFNPDNIFYLSNFANMVHERPFILVLPAKGDPIFVMPRLEEPHVRIRSVGALEFAPYFEFPAPEGEGWDVELANVLNGMLRLGVEEDCPLFLVEALDGRHQSTQIVEDLRMIKSPWELSRNQ